MLHREFRQFFYQSLTEHYLQGELMALYHWCMEEIHGWNRSVAYLHNDEALDAVHLKRWEDAIKRLQQKEPVQYIFNKAHFRELELFVDTNVLVPRPETEELVELVLQRESQNAARVLDIGTGSGCIALALKSERPDLEVKACDVSEEALSIAERNAKALDLNVHFFQMDVGDPEQGSQVQNTDIIVSNPPYIQESSKGAMESNVLDFEPHLALFAPENDPFFFFRAITRLGNDAGVRSVYFETEAVDTPELVADLKTEWEGSISVEKDLQGKERFLVLSR